VGVQNATANLDEDFTFAPNTGADEGLQGSHKSVSHGLRDVLGICGAHRHEQAVRRTGVRAPDFLPRRKVTQSRRGNDQVRVSVAIARP
jgi:hypothetical protein